MRFFENLEHQYKMRRQYKKLRGIKLDVSQSEIDLYVKEQIVRGLYEHEEFYLLTRLLKPEDRVLELGACVGFLSAAAAKICGSSNVMCVEANPELISVIETNHSLNGVSPKLVSGIAALKDVEQSEFFVGERASGSSILEREGSRKILQKTVNVNRLIAEFDPSFLMMDIEGAEIDLLPALDLSDIRMLIVEFHPKLNGFDAITECINVLTEKGFALRVDQCQNKCMVLQRTTDPDHAMSSQLSHVLEAQSVLSQ
ncbi:methyltransferase, FkbM family [Pseudovibrio denitrificans]|uniref:Methyltransferase, FkbM family n=1 Tax=Pseudovibrio denitrificans TaxID=258256 RepID=A0A1I7CQG7_9HYPH|nr:FkbM family methyltransferase [Pseudovibrio denitrificans]SFU01706.1 methyltransferase, FkbM family [Pseudovibrio denitrificans]